jgi:hypothetical protein
VIVGDLYIISVTISPDKADSVLIVDADAVLAFAISRQSFEVIAREDRQIVQLTCAM